MLVNDGASSVVLCDVVVLWLEDDDVDERISDPVEIASVLVISFLAASLVTVGVGLLTIMALEARSAVLEELEVGSATIES